MKPIQFPEQHGELSAPEGVDESQCGKLPVIKTTQGMVSCWQMDEDELKEFNKNGGKLWLHVLAYNHPMIALTVEKPFTISATNETPGI